MVIKNSVETMTQTIWSSIGDYLEMSNVSYKMTHLAQNGTSSVDHITGSEHLALTSVLTGTALQRYILLSTYNQGPSQIVYSCVYGNFNLLV